MIANIVIAQQYVYNVKIIIYFLIIQAALLQIVH